MNRAGHNKDSKDWRVTRNPRHPLRRAEPLRVHVDPALFISRELTAIVDARLSRLSAASDPVEWCTRVLGVTPTRYQSLILGKIAARPETVPVRIISEVGTTYALALAALWWLHSAGPNTAVVTTAPSRAAVFSKRSVWEAMKTLSARARNRLAGRFEDGVLDISEAWYGAAFVPDDAAKVSGTEHAKLLVLVDRADQYPVDGLRCLQDLAGRNKGVLVLAGLTRASGPWAELCKANPGTLIIATAEDSPNVASGKLIIPGLLTRERLELLRSQLPAGERECSLEGVAWDPPPGHKLRDDPSRPDLHPATTTISRRLKDVVTSRIDQKLAESRYGTMSLKRFAAERLWVRDKAGKIVRFATWPLQERYSALKRLARLKGFTKILLLKYRRGGFTTQEQAESYKRAVTVRNSRCLTLAHTDEQTTEIFKISRRFYDHDPFAPSIKGVGNARRLEFPSLGSSYFTATASGNAPGRGDTLSRVHGSEVSKWCRGPNQSSQVADLVSGFTEAVSNPLGEDGEIVMETTAYGVDGWFCPTYRDAKKGINDWFPVFLPWFVDPNNRALEGDYNEQEVLESLTTEEKELITRAAAEFHAVIGPAQIAWRRQKVRALGVLFPQEYPEDDETCFLTSGTPYFPVHFVLQVLKRLKRSYSRKEIPGGIFCIAEQPKRGRLYVQGSDTSEGVAGGDPSAICVMDKVTGKQCAWAYGLFRPEVHAEVGIKLARMYNDAVWGIERQNHGHAVIQAVKKAGYHNLYKFDGTRQGWDSNSQTRPVLLDELRQYLEESPEQISDDIFLSECTTFKLQDSGRFEADVGMHDDTIIGWGIANQLRTRAVRPGITSA